MNQSKQVDLGNLAEGKMADYFKGKGYWCHIFSRNRSGSQPVDLIAMKAADGVVDVWLCDVKNVEEGYASLPFSRVEPNQESTLHYAKEFAGLDGPHCHLGFIVVFDRIPDDPKFLGYSDFLKRRAESCSANMNTLESVSEIIKGLI